MRPAGLGLHGTLTIARDIRVSGLPQVVNMCPFDCAWDRCGVLLDGA